MKPHDEGAEPTIILRAHPPERLVRSLARGHIAGACCCCCCCCLHSVGSLTGAAVGSFFPRTRTRPASGETKPLDKPWDDELAGPTSVVPAAPRVGSMFWMATLGASIVMSWWAMAQPSTGGFKETLLYLAIYMPALQLAGAVICLLIILSIPQLRRDARGWKKLGFITVGAIVGGLLGTLIMYMIAEANAHR
ncbi:MAG: hypothetical protein ACLQGP_04065 [Isosphaeraceae bacterium]